MKKLWAVWFVIQLLLTSTAEAQSIVEIPKGTVFTLLEELEIPANRDFILLGKSELDEAFNTSGQVLNDQAGRPLVRCGTGVHQPGYLTFTTYYQRLFESYEQTYLNCLERHRVYVRAPGPPAPPVVIQQGHGNVAVINQHGHPTDTVYTTIGDNYCTPPNHTVAALVINQNKADGGGFCEGLSIQGQQGTLATGADLPCGQGLLRSHYFEGIGDCHHSRPGNDFHGSTQW